MNNPNPNDVLQEILAELADGKLSDEQFRLLDQLMTSDPALREEYRKHVELLAMLQFEHRPQPASEAAASPAAADKRAAPVIPDLTPALADGLEQLVIPPSAFHASSFFGSAGLAWGLLGVAVAAFTLLWFTGRGNDGSRVAGNSAKAPSVQILSGTTKLMLPDVGYVIVDGPAEFDMLDPMRARLNTGRIKMRVTEKTGRGFVVETPYGDVTDLGTEFGLDVSDAGHAGVVVFDGEVDLSLPATSASDKPVVERLARGDGVRFGKGGMDRIGAIRRSGTDAVETFELVSETHDHSVTIANVVDNLTDSTSKKFYEIASGGLREGALVYVDRMFVFNPFKPDLKFLEGADYVKTFNNDRYQKDLKILVTLARPAKLYVIFDSRLDVPDWLSRDFRQFEDLVYFGGSNTRTSKFRFTTGFSVWERVIKQPGTVELGYCYMGDSSRVAMYSIAAVPLEEPEAMRADSGSPGSKQAAEVSTPASRVSAGLGSEQRKSDVTSHPTLPSEV